jgi:hypothetical protein
MERVHASHRPIARLRRRRQWHWLKPTGLWYAAGTGTEWLTAAREMWGPGHRYRHFYDVTFVDQSLVLVIAKTAELRAFTAEYAERSSAAAETSLRFAYIDWARVAEDFDAVEVVPYLWSCRLEYSWYYGWDCASGCVLNPKAVRLTPVSLRTLQRRQQRARTS